MQSILTRFMEILIGVSCNHIRAGCTWFGPRTQLNEHLQVCRYVSVRCPNRKLGCPFNGRRRDMDMHFLTCDFTETECDNDNCEWKGCRNALEEHQSVCPHAIVQCEYAERGCNWKGYIRELEEHLKGCEFAEVNCPFAEAGHIRLCDAKLPRSIVASHVAECRFKKLAYDIRSYEEVHKREIEVTKTENAALATAVDRAKKESAEKDRKIGALEQKSLNQATQIHSLDTKLAASKKATLERGQKIEQLHNALREYEMEYNAQEEKIRELDDSLTSLRKLSQSQTQTISQMGEFLRAGQQELRDCQKKLETSKDCLIETKKQLEDAKKETSERSRKVADADRTIELYRKQKIEFDDRILKLTRARDSLQGSVDAQAATMGILRDTISRQSKELHSEKTKSEGLRQQLENSKKLAEGLKEQAQAMMKQFETSKKQADAWKKQSEEAKRQSEGKNKELKELSSRLEETKANLKSANQKVVEKSASQRPPRTLQQLVDETKQRSQKQQETIEELKNEVSQLQEEIAEQEQKIQDRDTAIAALNEKAEQREAELIASKAESKEEKKNHESTIHHLETVVKNLRHEVQEQKRTIQEQITTVREISESARALEEENEELRASLLTFETESVEYHRITQSLRDALKTRSQELADKQQTVTSLTARMERERTTYQQQMTQWRNQMEAKEREKARLQEQIENVQGLVGVLKEEKRQQKQQLHRLVVENDGLKEGKLRQQEQHQMAPAAEAAMVEQQEIIQQVEKREMLKQQGIVRDLRIEIDVLKRQKEESLKKLEALRNAGRKLRKDHAYQEERIEEMSMVLWNMDPEKRFVLDQNARSDKSVQVESVEGTESVTEYRPPIEGSTVIAVSWTGTLVLAATTDDTVTGWDMTTKQQVLTLMGHTAPITSIALSDDDTFILTGSEDTTAKVWKLTTPTTSDPTSFHPLYRLHQTLEGHTNHLTSLTLHTQTQKALTASLDKTARLWSLQTATLQTIYTGHKSRILTTTISKDAKLILTGSTDHTAKIWIAETGEHLLNLDHSAPVLYVATSAHGICSITFAVGGGLAFWNVGEKKGFVGSFDVLAVRQDAEMFVLRESELLQVWKPKWGDMNFGDDKCLVCVLDGGWERGLRVVRFGCGGDLVVVRFVGGRVRVWDAVTGLVVGELDGIDGTDGGSDDME